MPVAVNFNKRKAMGKKNGTGQGLKNNNKKKNDSKEYRKKRITKWKSNLKSRNS